MKEKENRTVVRSTRYTEKEYIELQKRMLAMGYRSIARFTRDCVLGKLKRIKAND